jgi:hypothetical protein
MPRIKPTEENRRKVRTLSACGIESDDIAKYIGISENALERCYAKDIHRAKVESNVRVGKALLEMATVGAVPAAAIYWSKTRGSFREHQETATPSPAAIPNFVVSMEKKAA